MSVIDVSVTLHSDIPMWPGSPKFSLKWLRLIKNGDSHNNGSIETDLHVGTHIDAPFHFVKGGRTIEQLSLETLVGPAIVVHLPQISTITAQDIQNLSIPRGVKRLLLKTDNSLLWGKPEFDETFTALSDDAAEWVVKRGINLIGIDYLSVQKYQDDSNVHNILLRAGVIIVEGLNLRDVEPGEYELICLPLKILGADGAPARVVLRCK